MPQPGDINRAFIVEPGRCWRMVCDHNLQGIHCAEPAAVDRALAHSIG